MTRCIVPDFMRRSQTCGTKVKETSLLSTSFATVMQKKQHLGFQTPEKKVKRRVNSKVAGDSFHLAVVCCYSHSAASGIMFLHAAVLSAASRNKEHTAAVESRVPLQNL